MENIDPQMQNPNVPPVMSPLSQVPPITSTPAPMSVTKKQDSWFLITIVAIGAFGGYALWLVGQMGVEPIFQLYSANKEAREDMTMDKDIEATDIGNIDVEFESVDKDINSL